MSMTFRSKVNKAVTYKNGTIILVEGTHYNIPDLAKLYPNFFDEVKTPKPTIINEVTSERITSKEEVAKEVTEEVFSTSPTEVEKIDDTKDIDDEEIESEPKPKEKKKLNQKIKELKNKILQ